jgi:hypothetical protein
MIAARIALLLNLQKKRLETVKAAQWACRVGRGPAGV